MRALAIITLLAAAACGSKHEAQTLQVEIRGMQFMPQTLSVHVGDHVTWTNKDLVPHTTTAKDLFDSGPIQPSATWSFTVTKPGQIDYVCTLHPTMSAHLFAE
ncbi:MAG: cupredoxin domain-containing protein [Deltaproteobacteria bacterium]|nr:cupredoxin domain-containing protein [Deltaproteobacteria bacterium]